ncbi:MAG: hypothetical protein IJ955_08690 [Oscillospiraceae bacterium]|nr:hypothetical protein [Oscillospiraceae bacterium]
MEKQNITLAQMERFMQEADRRMDVLELRQGLRAVPFTIPVTGWGTDGSVPGHPLCYDIAVEGLSETDIVCVDVAPAYVAVARAADFSTVESYAGRFRLRAKRIPAQPIQAQYRMVRTAEKEV